MKPVYPSLAFAFLMFAVFAAALLWESPNHVTTLILVATFVVSCSFFAGKSVRSYVEDLADSPSPSPRGKSSQRRSNGSIVSNPPTREDLRKLKETLGLDAGSLQFKRRGQGVYHVVYSKGKYCWVHLGSWESLKGKLES